MSRLDIPADQVAEWFDDAACRGAPLIFFAPPGRREDAPNPEAVAICSRCTVRDDCLTYALEHNERHGIWGGLNPTQRRAIQRRTNERP